ncbi:MAG: cobaltochelatase CobT-related protein [Lachnospiraceae bacterium]
MREENIMDIRSRIQNVLWTVSEDYDLDIRVDEDVYRKSRYIAFYDAIRQGAFEKYFDARAYDHFIAKKVYAGMNSTVLTALGKICIDSAVWKKAEKERKGVAAIRKRAYQDTLEKDIVRLTHTDWDYIEKCYLEYVLYGEKANDRIQPLLERICSLCDTQFLQDICTCLEWVYKQAYAAGFAKDFKGLDRHVKNSDKDRKEYAETETTEEEVPQSDDDRPVNIFSGHVDAQDNGQQEKSKARMIYLDQESTARMEEYVERNYGKSCLTEQEKKYFNSQICRGIHEECRIHMTEGILHCQMGHTAKAIFVRKVKEENLKEFRKKQLVTRQNIQVLAGTLKRALLTRTEKEICSSDYGMICVPKLWNVGRTKNRRLFERELIRDNTDFVVEVLIDASGSQQGRQSLVALQGYIISEALSIVRIPHRVVGFCTFGAYTILNKFRDYEDGREINSRIFEFYGSANNRDGLAVRAVADSLEKRDEENKILIVLSDGRPSDIIAGIQDIRYEDRDEKHKEPYCLDYAVKDTAGEIRKLRNRKIAVLGVFAGEEEDLQAEKKIFGKDFAYIRDITDFANVVGRYLQKQIAELE